VFGSALRIGPVQAGAIKKRKKRRKDEDLIGLKFPGPHLFADFDVFGIIKAAKARNECA